LNLDDDLPVAITLPLRDAGAAPVEAPPGRSLAVRLVNETGRAVRPQLLDGAGASQLWLRLPEIAARAEAQLPLIALAPGDYEIRDRPRDATVARLMAR
jgi:hypothetical protein